MLEAKRRLKLLPIYKEHNLSSIHNCSTHLVWAVWLLPIYKEHNLSSIHNESMSKGKMTYVVTNIQRTQFKFNSQPILDDNGYIESCYQYTKNTI